MRAAKMYVLLYYTILLLLCFRLSFTVSEVGIQLYIPRGLKHLYLYVEQAGAGAVVIGEECIK